MTTPLKIGTRGSPLALAQTELFIEALKEKHAHLRESGAIEIVKIVTSGDRIQDRPLSEAGGKGLFTKEIEEALLAGSIDCAVHSMKDMPTELPKGLGIPCLLPREDVRDAFFSNKATTIAGLPQGAVVGTSSLRRRAQLAHRRPDLRLVEFRGNVQTRMKKLEDGVAQATLLAMAGLNRLGLSHMARSAIAVDEMLPAVAQGAIGVERRADDPRAEAMLAAIHHAPTGQQLTAERAYLLHLDGSCETPIAGLAVLEGDNLWLRGEILRPDGSKAVRGDLRGTIADAADIGRTLAADLLGRAGPGFFA